VEIEVVDESPPKSFNPPLTRLFDPLCLTTQVFQQRMNNFSNHSQNYIKYQHTNVLTW
jgi:hypothetical protein